MTHLVMFHSSPASPSAKAVPPAVSTSTDQLATLHHMSPASGLTPYLHGSLADLLDTTSLSLVLPASQPLPPPTGTISPSCSARSRAYLLWYVLLTLVHHGVLWYALVRYVILGLVCCSILVRYVVSWYARYYSAVVAIVRLRYMGAIVWYGVVRLGTVILP